MFPTTCHWFVTLQQVSSGQTSRGKFCVSKQLHKPATFLHTNEGFPYANREEQVVTQFHAKALSLGWTRVLQPVALTKYLPFAMNKCLYVHGVKPGNAPSLPVLVFFLITQTEACKGSTLWPGEMQRSPHSCNHQCDRWYGHFHISKCTFWFNWECHLPSPHPKVPAWQMFKYVHNLISGMGAFAAKRSAAGD